MPNECLRVVVSAYMGDQTRSTRGGCRENIRQLISLLEEMSAENMWKKSVVNRDKEPTEAMDQTGV